jgi:hypothetical protein
MLLGHRLVRTGILGFVSLASGACSYEQAEWNFDKGDMEAAVHGTWHGDYTAIGGTPLPLTLEIKAPDPSLAPQCGTRTFSEGGEMSPGLAPTCSVESQLMLSGTLSVDETSFAGVELAGYFLVGGNQLSSGELSFDATSAGFNLVASWRDGGFEDCSVWDREKVADCTLSERD